MCESKEQCGRFTVSAADALLGRRFDVLDDGFVRLIDYMGGDEAVVQAARVSYGVGTRHVSENRALIRYLMRHRHTTPFEMCELKLHVRVPMDCWRQWIRHRTASVNEYSTRYSLAIDAAQRTPPEAWRAQSVENRQGSGCLLDSSVGERLSQRERELQALCRDVYRERIDAGVAREQARKDLPLSTYTEAYWKVDLHNLLHFLELRMTPAAQAEVRAYAVTIGEEIVKPWAPLTWEAFTDYRLDGVALSRRETELLRLLTQSREDEAARHILDGEWVRQRPDHDGLIASREAREFEQKVNAIGLGQRFRDVMSRAGVQP